MRPRPLKGRCGWNCRRRLHRSQRNRRSRQMMAPSRARQLAMIEPAMETRAPAMFWRLKAHGRLQAGLEQRADLA